MIKNIITIFFICFSFVNASEAQTLTSMAIKKVVDLQIKYSEDERQIGMWPISVHARSLNIDPIAETDSFTPMQIALSLLRVKEHYFDPSIENIFTDLMPQLQFYIADSIEAKRPSGSISFWPKRKLTDGEDIFNFARDQETLDLFANLNIQNDMDSSSRLALLLNKIDPDHEFIADFLSMASRNIYSSLDGFAT